MKTIKDFTTDEIRHGIIRCKHKLSFHDYGLMRTAERVKKALIQYENELKRRRQNKLEFK